MTHAILALSYAFCWGVGVTLTKIALTEIPATTLLVIQLLSSVLCLAIACYLRDHHVPLSWHHLKQGVAGVFEPALAYMVGIFGVQMTSVSNATLIGASEVILTLICAAIFLSEPLTRTKILLAALSVSGILLLMLEDTYNSTAPSSLMGDLLILLGTLFAVCYVLVSKKQIATANPLHLTASQQFVGLVVTVLCFSLLSTLSPTYEINASGISPQFWLLAISSGIIQYALAFLLYLMALQQLPVSHAAFYIALIPVFGITSSVLLMGEQPGIAQWIGGGLVIVSSYYANRLDTA